MPAERRAQVKGPFLLQPDVARVVVGQLDDEGPQILRQRRGNLLHERFLTGDVHRGEHLVFVHRAEQFLVLGFAQFLDIRKRRNVAQRTVTLDRRHAAFGQFHEFV